MDLKFESIKFCCSNTFSKGVLCVLKRPRSVILMFACILMVFAGCSGNGASSNLSESSVTISATDENTSEAENVSDVAEPTINMENAESSGSVQISGDYHCIAEYPQKIAVKYNGKYDEYSADNKKFGLLFDSFNNMLHSAENCMNLYVTDDKMEKVMSEDHVIFDFKSDTEIIHGPESVKTNAYQLILCLGDSIEHGTLMICYKQKDQKRGTVCYKIDDLSEVMSIIGK